MNSTTAGDACGSVWTCLPYGCQCKFAYIILLIIPIIIVIYWIYLLWKNKSGINTASVNSVAVVNSDILNRKVGDMPYLENCCSWWPISHFLLFFILGVLFPHCDVLIIGAGIIWELLEMLMSYFFNRQRQPIKSESNVEYSGNWWAGSFKDIVFNIAGFYLGKWYRLTWGQIAEHLKSKQQK